MEEKILEIKHVADLLGMHFHIPSYQRGYRWEVKHVEALLEDLYNFSLQMDDEVNKTGKFYCIQPLAVVKNKKMSKENEIVYDVIDGQQRLTTLYLILSYLQDARNILYSGKLVSSKFTLKYESRDSDFFDKEEFKNSDIKKAIRNIDFFYMFRAYKAIEAWFEKTGVNKGLILKVIIPAKYKMTLGLEGNDLINAKENNDKENDVRFIWYEVPVEENTTDSIEIFSQLNYGKTPLTATELVKALLFQCDIYTKDKKLMREITFRRSCEWDTMEKQLQDPFMWYMFMASENDFASHINIVLQLVCNELYKEMTRTNRELKIDKNSEDFIYQVCFQFLTVNKTEDYAENVTKIWERIQTVYTALYNWYKNSDIYHLIGLLVWLKEYKGRDFNNKSRLVLLQELMDEYSSKSKDEFVDYLRIQIAEKIHIDDYIKTKEGEIPWGLKCINYNDNALQIIRILVTFNVEEIRKEQSESARFPFHLLRKYGVTSLEHIHPQNLVLDNIKLDTLKAWLDVKTDCLKQVKMYNIYEKEINDLKNIIQDEESYKDNKEYAQKIINQIDKEFDDLVNMHESQMHTLYNMALVDKDTNAALSNNLLDRKREILRNRQEQKVTYIMPSTQKVFAKYYSPANEANVTPKLWTKTDRDAYFEQIEKTYNDFNSFYKYKRD